MTKYGFISSPRTEGNIPQYHLFCLYCLLTQKEEYSTLNPEETVYLEGMETAPLRFAISRRNDLMLKEADIVICYVKHSFGGSGKMVDKAIRQKKKVINLADR